MNDFEFLEYVTKKFKVLEIELKEQMYINWYVKDQLKEITIEFLNNINKMEVI